MGESAPIGGSCTTRPFGSRRSPVPPEAPRGCIRARGSPCTLWRIGMTSSVCPTWHARGCPYATIRLISVWPMPMSMSAGSSAWPPPMGSSRGTRNANCSWPPPSYGRSTASTTSQLPLRPRASPHFSPTSKRTKRCCSSGGATRKPVPSCSSLTVSDVRQHPAGGRHPWTRATRRLGRWPRAQAAHPWTSRPSRCTRSIAHGRTRQV